MKFLLMSFIILLLNIFQFSLFSSELKFSEKALNCKGHRTTVNQVVFNHDGSELITCGGNNEIIVFNTTNGKILRSFKKSKYSINAISLNYNGKLLIAGGLNDKNIKIFSMNDLSLLKVINGFKSVEKLLFSPISNLFAVLGVEDKTNKQTLILYDAESGKKIKKIFTEKNKHKSYPLSVDFSSDGKYIAIGTANYAQGIHIFEVETGLQLKLIKSKDDINSLKFSPNGKYIAGGLKGVINIWDVKSGKLIKSLKGLTNYILALDYSPDGKYLAAAGMDHKSVFKLWSTSTGKLIQTVGEKGPDINSISFSPDGESLAVALRTYGNAFDVATTEIYKTNKKKLKMKWYTLVFPESEFHIDFPAKPEVSSEKNRFYEYYDYLLKDSGFVYLARSVKYMYSLTDNKKKEIMNKKLASYKIDRSEIVESNFFTDGKKGIDLITYKKDIRYHYRFIFINETFYYILVSSRNKKESVEEERFLNSFGKNKTPFKK